MDYTTSIVEFVIIITLVLSIASVLLALSNKLKIPFTVSLVVLGAIIAQLYPYGPERLRDLLAIELSPDLIFYVCLPTLIFESAYNLDAKKLQQNMLAVLTLAIPGLLISSALIGFIVSFITGIDFLPCLLLGAILSATDPVAVISIFKKLGAPKRLTVLVEGESLFNDATSIVTSKIILTVILAGSFSSHHVFHGIYDFLKEFIGGVVVGGAIAMIVGYFLGKVENNREIEISLTAILAYTVFLLAQDVFHVSGVMASVSAGLVMSTWGQTRISPDVMDFMHKFWEFLAYFANAVIFLLVGFSVNLWSLVYNYEVILAVIGAMLISRALVVFGLIPIVQTMPKQPYIDYRYQSVMYWGGLRGAIALGIVLSLEKFEYTDLFTTMVLGAVLFTLLVQGLSIEKLVRYLGLTIPPLSEQLSKLESNFQTKKEALNRIHELQSQGMLSNNIYKPLSLKYSNKLAQMRDQTLTFKKEKINTQDELQYLYFQCFSIEKMLYYDLFSKGHFADQTYRNLIQRIENRFDLIRAGEMAIKHIKIFSTREYWKKRLLFVLYKIPLLSLIAKKISLTNIALNYTVAWGQYQGSIIVLDYLKGIEEEQLKDNTIIQRVINYYKHIGGIAKKKLDAIADQFPEYVMQMQNRLANRVLLHVELEGVKGRAKKGIIPASLATELEMEINKKLSILKEYLFSRLHVDDKPALQRNKLLDNLSQKEIDIIVKATKLRIVPADEIVLKEKEQLKSVFLIVRGVIRIIKDEAEKEITTLLATDYFGLKLDPISDISLVTSRAETPCILAEIPNKKLESLINEIPNFKNNVEKARKEQIFYYKNILTKN